MGLNAYELEIGLVLSLANIVSMSFAIPSARMRLGITFGPIVGGYLYSQVNYNSPFLASAVLIAVSLMVGLSFKDNRVTKSVKDIQIIK